MNTSTLPRNLIIYGILIPLTLLVGYMLSSPLDYMSIGFVGLVVSILAVPILLKWHYPVLILSWNLVMNLFFLPGQPQVWMLAALISLGISVLNYVMERQSGFQNVRSITWPLLVLLAVVLVTAKFTGGIGLNSLGGGTYGGKKFVFLLLGIAGYFAISCRRIEPKKAERYVGMYFLSAVSSVASNLIYIIGPAFWWLFLIFPVDAAVTQAMDEFSVIGPKLGRLTGTSFLSLSLFCFFLARHGITGMFSLRHPWRVVILIVLSVLGMFGGFRSILINFGLILFFQFFFERIYRTRLFLVLVLTAVLGGSLLIPFASKLPLSVQRSLSFLPLEVSPIAKVDAQASWDWRLQMWRVLTPQIPQYFWLGKGYALDPTDLYLTQEAMARGLASGYEVALVSGDYHSGPLSILIPLGIWGLLAFLWFCFASMHWLYRCYRDGPEHLQKINIFFLSLFMARFVFFFVGFGSLYSDMPTFVGLVGLSIALNGTKKEKVQAAEGKTLPTAAPVALAPSA